MVGELLRLFRVGTRRSQALASTSPTNLRCSISANVMHRAQKMLALGIFRIGARVVNAVPPKDIIVSKCSRMPPCSTMLGE